MSPQFCHNDYVLVARWFGMKLEKGDVVIARHHLLGRILKRISGVSVINEYQLSGDHISSVSSESIGPVTKEEIQGKVLLKIARQAA